jgi:hypothetical protein
MTYQLVANSDLILRVEDNFYISPGTMDYEEYRKWLSRGNQPLPANAPKTYPKYQEFWDLLILSNAYQKILQQAFTSLAVNTCCTLFIASFGDAKLGKANAEAIQNCIYLLLQNCELDDDDLTEINEILVQTELNTIFTLTPPNQ